MLTHRDVLRRCASSYAQRVALVAPDGRALTYEQLDEVTNRVANALLERGIQPGDRMLWIDQNSVEYLVAYYATAKAGLEISAMNYWLRVSELEPQIALIEPAVVVAGPEYLQLARAAVPQDMVRLWVTLNDVGGDCWVPWSALLSGSPQPVDVEISEDTLHEVVFTSGTTGQAKGVTRSQRARILDSMNAALAYKLTRDDHMVWFLPQFHIGGGSVPNQLIVQGGKVTILRKFEPEDAARAVGAGVTYVVGVPAHYNLMFQSGALDGIDTGHVRGCYVGGSVASRRMFEEILLRFPNADLVHGYGSTESGPHTMALRGQDFLEHFGALGLPVPGTEARVVDPKTGTDVGVDEVGELWVWSDSVMAGYLGRSELTEAAFAPGGWLRMGDLVRRDADGYFSLVDRVKDMIITGGENVYPKEVEDVISAVPGVAEVAVIGVPDDVYEERVVAVVRADPGGVAPEADEIISFVRSRLAGYKTPKEVHFVDDFPRTGVGKIAKHDLRGQYGSIFGANR